MAEGFCGEVERRARCICASIAWILRTAFLTNRNRAGKDTSRTIDVWLTLIAFAVVLLVALAYWAAIGEPLRMP